MGLFDEVRSEYPLPDPAHQRLLFQTKDLGSLMDRYVITKHGRLVRKKNGGLFHKTRRDVVCPIHQELLIYTSVEVASEEEEWVEYVFRFTEGRVTGVRRSRDRHRFKVRKWDPEEWRKQEPVAPAPPESEGQKRLQPALRPRRPTPEEFTLHTPEKLELIDSHVPGEENLLLLLLTTMGLRRAAQLVGPKLWRSAAAPIRWPVSRARPRPKRKRRP
jgi:hypothetical protein